MRTVWVVLNDNFLSQSLYYTDFEYVKLEAIVCDNELDVSIGGNSIPCYKFKYLKNVIDKYNKEYYFIVGYNNSLQEYTCLKEILTIYGVDEKMILNYTVNINLLHLKKIKFGLNISNVDFFVTGISYTEAGIDLRRFDEFLGVNLALSGQDLESGYRLAELLLKKNKFRFAIIGLAPYSFRYEIRKSFGGSFYLYHYQTIFDTLHISNIGKNRDCLNRRFYNMFKNADIATYEEILSSLHPDVEKDISMRSLLNFPKDLRAVEKKYHRETIDENINILCKYLSLCRSCKVIPFCVVFPFQRLLQEMYSKDSLFNFRLILNSICDKYSVDVVDLFGEQLSDDCFSDLSHLNKKGAEIVSAYLNEYIRRKVK